MRRWRWSLAWVLALLPLAGDGQSGDVRGGNAGSRARSAAAPQLRYVVYVSRHGVRSPTGKSAQYNQFSSGAWPEWPVQPGYLTPHGFHLMELFGAYDRASLAERGLLPAEGCAQAENVTIYADSDERTRETGKALAQGLMPGCRVDVQGFAEGTNDPLFHSPPGAGTGLTPALAKAAIAGRIGDAGRVTEAYREPLAELDRMLATCGTQPAEKKPRTSLFAIPASLSEGNGDHLAEMKGPINTAATLSENLLLEYTEGMPSAQVGWGCVNRDKLESLMTLHTAATDFTNRTPAIAKAQSANLLRKVAASIEQAASGKRVEGAVGKPSDRVLILVGHDTNLENIAGALNLTWILDGRRDDTPPGSALVFEVWSTGSGYSVRAFMTAQTLEQMRSSSVLSLSAPPDRVPVFLPGCSEADMSCPLSRFAEMILRDSR